MAPIDSVQRATTDGLTGPSPSDDDPLRALRPDAPRSWRDRFESATGGLAFFPDRSVIGRWAIVLAVALVGLGIVWFNAQRGQQPRREVSLPYTTPGTTSPRVASDAVPRIDSTGDTAPKGIWVHAAGAVVRPGLYLLRVEARLSELLVAAGGHTVEADLDRTNLAAVLADGEHVYVPRRGDQSAPSVVAGGVGGSGGGGLVPSTRSGTGSTEPASPVNVNTATAEALERLPGVGPVTAAAIIQHRTEQGRFQSIDDLKRVRGIGPSKFEQLRGLVTV